MNSLPDNTVHFHHMQHNGVVCFQHLQEETVFYINDLLRTPNKLHHMNVAVIRVCVYIL